MTRPGDGANQRAFACSVGPEQAKAFPGTAISGVNPQTAVTTAAKTLDQAH